MLRATGSVLLVAAFWLAAGTVSAQISPGPLSQPHASLDGAKNCTSCHVFGIGQRALKCLDCHAEIARRIDAKTGYHAGVYKSSNSQLDCARCHSEHNGKRYQLTKFDHSNFDHAKQTGFELQGKHSSLKCESCHNASHVTVRVAEIQVKDKNKTFLGLPQPCSQCHQDPHQGELGGTCTTCHSQDAWKPAALFDHNRSYPLTGRHSAVQCTACHKPAAGQKVPHFRGLKSETCDNCHADPHRGAFGSEATKTDCASCHLTEGWKVQRSDFGFNHSLTKFPLEGKHRGLDCNKCHASTDFSKPVAHGLCADCHKDVHQGQFAKRAEGSDCSACHNLQGFKPALYTRENHERIFRLEGKHASLECASCHKPGGPDAQYRFASTTCQSCHKDPHGAEFAAQPIANQCETCHTQTSFHPSTYTLSKHQQTRFVLTGAHVALACVDCHKPLAGSTSVAARQYHFGQEITTQNCTGCHQDPHETKTSCETCHNTEHWKPVRPFDHDSTRFHLEGAHQTAACASCHRPVNPAVAVTKAKPIANFARTPTLCHDCHEDIHGGQFMSAGEEKECTACHTLTNWSSRTFDHNKTHFSLEGAHAEVRCAQCHTKTLNLEGRESRVYRGAPTECKACHADGKEIAK